MNEYRTSNYLPLECIPRGVGGHIMILSVNTVMAVLKDLTYIFTSITAHAIKLAVMLELMSVSTFKTEVILYIFHPNLL
jgi:hypothetical protein